MTFVCVECITVYDLKSIFLHYPVIETCKVFFNHTLRSHTTDHFRDKKAIVIKMLQQAFNSDFSDLLRELLKF